MTISATCNADAFAMRMRQRAEHVTPELSASMRKIGQAALVEAVKLSSGTISLAEMRAVGHPYAKRNPMNIGPNYPAMINVQTGVFKKSWKVHAGLAPGGFGVTLENTSPEARYLTSGRKSKMIWRPILREIARRMRPEYQKEMRAGLRRAMAAGAGPQATPDAYARTFLSGVRQGFAIAEGLGLGG